MEWSITPRNVTMIFILLEDDDDLVSKSSRRHIKRHIVCTVKPRNILSYVSICCM